MLATVVSAVIGGLFTLGGIVLKHHLEQKAKDRAARPESPPPPSPSRTAGRPEPPRVPPPAELIDMPRPRAECVRRVKRGVQVLLVDFVVIGLVVMKFDLNRTDPWWETYFSLVVLGAVPMFAGYLIWTGVAGLVRSRFGG